MSTGETIEAIATADVEQSFKLTSPDFGPGKDFTKKFLFSGLGCFGDNISPELNWENPPEGTKSFALMVRDPHAQTGGAGIWHWVVVDIPGSARQLVQGAGTYDGAHLPKPARQISTDYAGLSAEPLGYGGPCPPKGHGPHEYIFTLYALGHETVELEAQSIAKSAQYGVQLPPNATASHYGYVLNREPLGKAVLVGRFERFLD